MSELQINDQLSGYANDDPTPLKDDGLENFTQKLGVKTKKPGSAAKPKTAAKAGKNRKSTDLKEVPKTSKVKKRMSDLRIEGQSGGNSGGEEASAFLNQNSLNNCNPYENMDSQRSRHLIDNLVDDSPDQEEGAVGELGQAEELQRLNSDEIQGKLTVKPGEAGQPGSSRGASPQTSDHTSKNSSNFSISNSNRTGKSKDGAKVTETIADVAEAWREAAAKPPAASKPTVKTVEEQMAAFLIPAALPLIRRISLLNSKEPDMYQKLRRATLNVPNQDFKDLCQHDEKIENWRCELCKASLCKFNLTFDDNEGRINTFTKIVYENSFLEDFKQEFKAQAAAVITEAVNRRPEQNPLIIYQAYQPGNVVELKEYAFLMMARKIQKDKKADPSYTSPFGTGVHSQLSTKLINYLLNVVERKKRLQTQFRDLLWFDSLFESGNLLQAQKSLTHSNTYNLFMQVDTNTRGHQQWFYFRCKRGKKGVKYTFLINNFTKPGVTGGRGYRSNEHDMRVLYKTRRADGQRGEDSWKDLTHENSKCEYIKTAVARRKKDVIAAGADSDQEEWVEEAFNQQSQAPATAGQGSAGPTINIPEKPEGYKPPADSEKPKEKSKKRKVFYYYALKFNFEFEEDDDTVYFAFARPVTYTDILEDLHNSEKLLMPPPKKAGVSKKVSKTTSKGLIPDDKKEKDLAEEPKKESIINPMSIINLNQFQRNIIIDNPNKLMYYTREEFCKTISGMPLYKIVVGRDQRSVKKNQIVLITSRVHSGETPGSEVFKGIYEFIIGDSQQARFLRRFYTFILIPCMNPDGVIAGNYRNSLAGADLNRQWINPEPLFHPEVCAVKNLMQQIKEEDKRQIWIFCDLHGHSKKNNSFFYGCNTAANGGFLSWTIVRLLPRIFAQKTHLFNYKDCRFRVEPYKIGTARVVAWKQFAITHSFTLENSFYGYDIGEDSCRILTSEDYYNIGQKFTLSIHEMHFLWKEIQRELRITHGWLKPRTLNEMTGVPAAQIVAEEAALLKEENRKKDAIRKYEEFLQTFYKSNNFRIKKRELTKGVNPLERDEDSVRAPNGLKDGKRDNTRNSLQSKLFSEDLNQVNKAAGKTTIELQSMEMSKIKNDDALIPKKINADLDLSQDVESEKEENDDQDYLFKMHQGLVKIQALIRGFLDRRRLLKKFKTKSGGRNKLEFSKFARQQSIPRQLSNQVLEKKSQSSGQKSRQSRAFYGKAKNLPSQQNITANQFDASSDGGLKATIAGTTKLDELDTSNDDQLMRSNTEQVNLVNLSDGKTDGQTSSVNGKDSGGLASLSVFGNRNQTKPRLDWREYFEDTELDKAYQIVEVEQRDETDNEEEGEASMGSNSDPSEDNFDAEEVYRDVYGLKNPQELINKRKIKEQEFIEKIQNEEVTEMQLVSELKKPAEDIVIPEVEEKVEPTRAKIEKDIRKFRISDSQERLLKEGSILGNKAEKQAKPVQVTEEESICATPLEIEGKSAENQDKPQINASQNNQMNGTHSPAIKADQHVDNIFQNMNYNPRRMLKSSNQQRAFTQHQNLQQVAQNPSNPQNFSHKKENINQVIKDCFITKKMNTKQTTQGNQQSGQWGPYNISPQKQDKYGRKNQNKISLKLNHGNKNDHNQIYDQQSKSAGKPYANYNKQQMLHIQNSLAFEQQINELNSNNPNQFQSQYLNNLDDAIHSNQMLMHQIDVNNGQNNQNSQIKSGARMSANQKRQVHPQQNTRVSEAYAAHVLAQMSQLNNGNGYNMNQARNSNNLAIQQFPSQNSNGNNLNNYVQPKSQMNYVNNNDIMLNQAYHNSLDNKEIKLQFYPSAKMDKSSKKLPNQNIRGNSSNQVLSHSGQIIESYGGSIQVKRTDQSQTIKAQKTRGLNTKNQIKEMQDLDYPSTDMYEATPISGSLKLQDNNQNNINLKEGFSNRNLPINAQLSDDRDNQNLFYSKNGIKQQIEVDNQINSSTKTDIGSSLFMKYVKKKANQQNYQTTPLQQSNHDQKYLLLSTPEKGMQQKSGNLIQILVPDNSQYMKLTREQIQNSQYVSELHGNGNVQHIYLNDIKDISNLQNLINSQQNIKNLGDQQQQHFSNSQLAIKPKQQNNIYIQQPQNNSAQQQQRINSAAGINQKGQHHKMKNSANQQDSGLKLNEILNTKELIEEIKQLRVHQQQQIQLQQQLSEQIKQQLSNQQPADKSGSNAQGFVQYNQFNLYDNNLVSSFYNGNEMITNQNTKSGQHRPPNPAVQNIMSLNSKNILVNQHQKQDQNQVSAKKQEIRKFQAHDKIPQGLQGLINKQSGIHQMFSGGTQIIKPDEKRRAETRGENRHHYQSNQRINQINGVGQLINQAANHKFQITKSHNNLSQTTYPQMNNSSAGGISNRVQALKLQQINNNNPQQN